jgi:hypothetical protein
MVANLLPFVCKIGVPDRLSCAALRRESGRLWPLPIIGDRYFGQFEATSDLWGSGASRKRESLTSRDLICS